MRATQKIMGLNDILRAAVKAQASDIHLKVGAIPHLRVGGQLKPVEGVSRLASSLTAVISLRLLPSSAAGGHVPAVEVLRNTELVRSLIEQPGRIRAIRAAMETGNSQYGMQTFDQSIHQLHEEGSVTLEEALHHASSPEDLKLRIQGIMTSQDSM